MFSGVALRIARGDLAGFDSLGADSLAIPLFAVREQPPLAGGFADWRLSGRIARLVHSGRFLGAEGEALLMPSMGRMRPTRVFLLGLGSPKKLEARVAEAQMHRMLGVARDAGAEVLALAPPALADPGMAMTAGAEPASLNPGVATIIFPLLERWLSAKGFDFGTLRELCLLDADGALAHAEDQLRRASKGSGLVWSGS